MKEVKLPFYVHMTLSLLAVVIVLFLLKVGAVVIIPLFFALLISALLYPLSKRLERLNLPRSISSLVSVVIFLACSGLFIYFLVTQIIHFSEDLPQFQKRIEVLLADLQAFISREYHVNATDQIAYLNKSASGMLEGVANSITAILGSVIEFFIWTIFVFIYTYFILFHRTLLYRFMMQLFSAQYRPKVKEVIDDTRVVINHYVLGLLLEMAIMTVINCSVFAIMGLHYALLLGMIAAVLNIIPYLGIYTAMAICMLVTIANGTGGQAVSVAIAMIIIHFIDANILMPRIVGGRVKMNALITILAVLVGNRIWGVSGMFLFIPLIAILKIIFERVDGLKPWALLIGTDDNKAVTTKKVPDKGAS